MIYAEHRKECVLLINNRNNIEVYVNIFYIAVNPIDYEKIYT